MSLFKTLLYDQFSLNGFSFVVTVGRTETETVYTIRYFKGDEQKGLISLKKPEMEMFIDNTIEEGSLRIEKMFGNRALKLYRAKSDSHLIWIEQRKKILGLFIQRKLGLPVQFLSTVRRTMTIALGIADIMESPNKEEVAQLLTVITMAAFVRFSCPTNEDEEMLIEQDTEELYESAVARIEQDKLESGIKHVLESCNLEASEQDYSKLFKEDVHNIVVLGNIPTFYTDYQELVNCLLTQINF